jgi:energy-coupling factor transporter ATP-binding protein EcfA2
MSLQITIPQIAPIKNSYTFTFKPGINLITGLNGSGKSRIALAILEKINTPLNANLILLNENFFVKITSDYLQDFENLKNSSFQKIICAKANAIHAELFNHKEILETITYKDNLFTYQPTRGAGERLLLNLIIVLAYRTLKANYHNIPLIIDGHFDILDKSLLMLAIKLLNRYTKYSILFSNPSFLNDPDLMDLTHQIASHHKIVISINKNHLDRLQYDQGGHLEATEIPTTNYLDCRIVSIK